MKLIKIFGYTIIKGRDMFASISIFKNHNFFIKSRNLCIIKNNKVYNHSCISFNKRLVHSNDDDNDQELSNGTAEVYTELYQQPQPISNILYFNFNDALVGKLNSCASLQDIHQFLLDYDNELNAQHITQLAMLLWELQKIFYHVSLSRSTSYIDVAKFDKLSKNYTDTLKNYKIYERISKLLERLQNEFNVEQLSYILWYLNKIGISPKEKVMLMLISHFQNKFTENTSLSILARFMSAIYVTKDLSFYYNIQEFIPFIINNIDKCNTTEKFHATTACLNSINAVVIDETLVKYKDKVLELLSTNVVNSNEYKTILSVLILLNIPRWREKNVSLIIDCLSLLKNHLHLLNVNELLMVNEIFIRIQEPGILLNELQRCASKYLLQLEDEMSPLLDIRLKLLSCIIYFASPAQRPHFHKIIRNYIDYNLEGPSLLELRRIISFTKTSDVHVCSEFWKKLTLCLNNKNFLDLNLLRICHSYIDFNEDIPGHRCVEFEEKMIEILERVLNNDLSGLLPSHFSTIASFLLVYGDNRETLNTVITRIKELAEYFNHVNCHNISHGLLNAIGVNKLLTKSNIINIKESLDKSTYKKLEKDCSLGEINLLFKSYIYRNSTDEKLYDCLWNSCRKKSISSSVSLKHTACNLRTTNTLLPDLIDNMVDYVIQQKTSILGFNAERILYLCFYLGYLPNNSQKFFQIIIDIIIRDQERISGLSYIQTCLSLCFFQALPPSFIQQVFSVEFLEKLDMELENCYFKDTYPTTVRHIIMQLNRAVCLDYPESNVPWFHQKYIDEHQRKAYKLSERDNALFNSIKECLLQITKNKDSIQENEISPYGYHIDFSLHLDVNNKFTDTNDSVEKIALMVIKPSFYTNVHEQLRGFYQLKIRHLEILGYKVALLNSRKWKKLISSEDKINYLIYALRGSELYSNVISTLKKCQ